MENTEENNKLIAEFMNVDHVDIDQAYEDYGELKYHTSWDWLMPVVDKIDSIHSTDSHPIYNYDVWIMSDCVRINDESKSEDDPMILINKSEGVGSINHQIHLFEDRRTATYKAVVEFIKWYNENK
jgi:hypothetical protein